MVLLSENILTFVRIIESSGMFRLLWLIATTATKVIGGGGGGGGVKTGVLTDVILQVTFFKILGELSCDVSTNSVQVFVAVLLFETVDK